MNATPSAIHVLPVAQYVRIQTSPVSAAIETNHSPRMNCFGVTPLERSMYHRPAVGPTTARKMQPRIGMPAPTPFCAPTIAYQGSEKEVMNWKRPSRKSWPFAYASDVAEQPERERERDVGGVRQRRRDVAEQHVAGDAAAEPAEQRHEQDADDREVLVVVGPPREQRAVERVRRGGDRGRRTCSCR